MVAVADRLADQELKEIGHDTSTQDTNQPDA